MQEKIKKIVVNFSIGLLIILILIFLIKIFDWGFLKSEITEYSVLCKEKTLGSYCENPEIILSPTIYKINYNRQEVLYWTGYKGFQSEIKRLTNCAVKNRKNWSCKYDDKSAEFGFTNGKFWDRTNPNNPLAYLDEKMYYVSKTEWLKLQCEKEKEGFNGSVLGGGLCLFFSVIFN